MTVLNSGTRLHLKDRPLRPSNCREASEAVKPKRRLPLASPPRHISSRILMVRHPHPSPGKQGFRNLASLSSNRTFRARDHWARNVKRKIRTSYISVNQFRPHSAVAVFHSQKSSTSLDPP
jgi:hypothetical protein